MKIRFSPQTYEVLESLLRSSSKWRYGYDLSTETGLKSGTLYPILMRLADGGVLETRWEQSEQGRPPRHMYRLTRDGAALVRAKLESSSNLRRTKLAEGRA